MRIAVTAEGTTLDSAVDPKFGRCRYFVIADPDGHVEYLENPHRSTSGGTGPRCAQLMVDHRVGTVLTGECGPHAQAALAAAGITVLTGRSGDVRGALVAAGGLPS